MVLTLIGGVGLFLVGMTMLTDGLKVAAGSALRTILARFTRNRFSAVASGALVTAVVQSSSATTLATIGFVSAGLLTFPQAIGVIFGANVGTTSTGWLVSLIGFKVQMSALAFPLIGAGALLMLLTDGSKAAAGRAVAGFGLIFVGIDFMQEAMASFADDIDLGSFRGDTIHGRLLLVLVGVVMTVVMQSSSAAVATTLTALNAGAINLDEAAALVIGQNMGTTVTAGVAAIGASVAARRTAVAHVLFNGVTGVVALAALPLFIDIADGLDDSNDPAISLAAFHTVFNVAGVVLLLPVIGRFSRLVERLVPEREPNLAGYLDDTVLDIPQIAIDAARRTALRIGEASLSTLEDVLAGRNHTPVGADVVVALEELQRFASRISASTEEDQERYLAVLHAIDHLHQLVLLAQQPPPPEGIAAFPDQRQQLFQLVSEIRAWMSGRIAEPPLETAAGIARELAEWRAQRRRELLEETARTAEDESLVEHVSRGLGDWRARLRRRTVKREPAAEIATGGLIEQLDAMVWLSRAAHHSWRFIRHLEVAGGAEGEPEGRVHFDPS